jgi:hypothetical protein
VDLFYFDLAEAQLDCQGSEHGWLDGFEPSTDWAQGGPIIERELIGLVPPLDERGWAAATDKTEFSYGPTALVAAMRCYVASKLGDDVDVPEELA